MTKRKLATVAQEQEAKKPKTSSTKSHSAEQKKWTNRERVMILCSRGASFRDRHLMQDFKTLLPHAKGESKLDKKQKLSLLTEMCEIRNCTKCVYFENRKKKDTYMWLCNVTRGPSAKFFVHNVHTMGELRMSGNCLKASRPIVSFDDSFEKEGQPHLLLLKELLTQTFATPNLHPRSQPFIDHVFNFSVSTDGRIWFRNYQIVEENGQLEEIGPRMVLEPIKVFEGSFGGAVLYENPEYTNPNLIRRRAKEAGAGKYLNRIEARQSLDMRRKLAPEFAKTDPLDDVFNTDDRQGGKDQSDDDSDENIPKLVTESEAAKIRRQLEAKRSRNRKSKNKKKPRKKKTKKEE